MNTPANTPQQKRPEAGEAVRVRTRTYLVESVQPSPGTGTLVRMACLDDDAQGQPLEVVWELELDPKILDREAWQSIGKRGDDEAESIRRVLEDQKRRVLTELGRYDQAQLFLSLDLEKRQLESNRRYWDKWLANVEGDLQREPDRVRKFYEVASFRIEPVGLAYLWPVSG